MKLHVILAFGTLLWCLPLSAQFVFPLKHNGIDLCAGGGKNVKNLSLAGYRCWSLGARPFFFLGAGFRANGTWFANTSFESPGQAENRVDRLESTGFVASGNLVLLVHYRPVSRMVLGANIDLAGVAAGTASAGIGTGLVSPKVGSFNLLLGPNKDIGSLNSEFYVGYSISRKLGCRAGWSHYFVQLKDGPQAYNSYFNLAFVAAEWRL